MTDSTTPTAPWRRLAAPDRHVPKRPVALPLCLFVPRRPASTMHHHGTAAGADGVPRGGAHLPSQAVELLGGELSGGAARRETRAPQRLVGEQVAHARD